MEHRTRADRGDHDSTVERLFLSLLTPSGACDRAKLDFLCALRPELSERMRDMAEHHARGHAALSALAGDDDARQALVSFGERYEVRGEIARGGMGVVLEVWDSKLRRTLAMKALRRDRGRIDPGYATQLEKRRARMLNEAHVLAQLEHPGIVPVHDVGFDDHGELYFTMLRVRGQTLEQVFASVRETRDGWSLTRALSVLLRVSEAVAYAHQKGVLHRDLKPSNVMVGAFGETYVMDWGLARSLDPQRTDSATTAQALRAAAAPEPAKGEGEGELGRLTNDGDIIGTPAYMAPEQARGERAHVDARADVYSIGAMLYELLSGAAPYSAELKHSPPHAVLAASLSRAPSPVEELAPRVPGELAAICAKAMARERDQRYASVDELASDLRAYLEGRVVRAHRTGALVELRKWVVRNKGAAAAIATVVVALASIASVQSVLKRDIERAQLETSTRAEALRRQNYANNVALAAAAWKDGVSARMRELLDACPADLRGWEWRFLDARVDTSELTVQTRFDVNGSVIFSPDGCSVLTCSVGRIEQFDAESGQLLRTLDEPPPITSSQLTVSHDARRLVAAIPGQRLASWTLDTFDRFADAPHRVSDSWTEARCSPTSGLVAICSAGPVEIRELESNALVAVLDSGQDHIGSVAWSPKGDRLYCGAVDGSVAVWDMDSMELIHHRREHSQRVNSLAASGDGKWIATAGWNRRVFIWDTRTMAVVQRTEVLPNEPSVDWSPDASKLAFTSGRTVRLLSAGDWAEQFELTGHRDWITDLAFDSAGARLAAVGRRGELRTWNLARVDRGDAVGSTRAESQAPRLSADGRLLFVPWKKRRMVEVWSVPDRRLVNTLRFPHEPSFVDVTPDGSRLVCKLGSHSVCLFDTKTGARLGEIAGQPVFHDAYASSLVRLSPDGARISIVGTDGSLSVWDSTSLTEQWRVQAYSGPYKWPYRLAGGDWSRDGQRIVTLPNDGRVQLWDAATGRLQRDWHARQSWCQRALFSPDGRKLFLMGSTKPGLECWDLASGACDWERPNESGYVLAMDRAGERLFCSRSGIDVRDPATGALIVSLELDSLADHGLALSPTDDVLVTASLGGLRIWDTRPIR